MNLPAKGFPPWGLPWFLKGRLFLNAFWMMLPWIGLIKAEVPFNLSTGFFYHPRGAPAHPQRFLGFRFPSTGDPL